MRRCGIFAVLVAAMVIFVLPAEAAKRLALVVGNSQYQSVAKLPNPANDAADISAELRRLGFDVSEGIDQTRSEFRQLVSDFRSKIKDEKPDDVVFYYAGHAFNLQGLNQFVPVDAQLKNRDRIAYETVRLDEIMSDIQVFENQKTVILLDACRNDPRPPNLRDGDSGAGLAMLEASDATANALVIFATLPGQVTKDGKGRNSPFARALLKHMGTPGKSIDEVFPSIRKDISAETNGAQKPFKQGSPPELFYFNPVGGAGFTAAEAPAEPEEPVSGPAQPAPEAVVQEPESPKAGGVSDPEPPYDVAALEPGGGQLIMGEEVPEPEPEAVAVAAAEPAPALETLAAALPLDPRQSPEAAPDGAVAQAIGPATGAEIGPADGTPLLGETETAAVTQQQDGADVNGQITRSTAILADTDGGAINPETAPVIAPAPSSSGAELAAAGGELTSPAAGGGLLTSTAGKDLPASATGTERQITGSLGELIVGIEVAGNVEPAQPPPLPETDVASLDPNQQIPQDPSAAAPGTVPPDAPDPELVGSIQEVLAGAGCFSGAPSGNWDRSSRNALEKFARARGLQVGSAEPSQYLLDQLIANSDGGAVCDPVNRRDKKPTPKKPDVVKKPAAGKPVAKNPVVKKPVVKTTPKTQPRKTQPIVIIGG